MPDTPACGYPWKTSRSSASAADRAGSDHGVEVEVVGTPVRVGQLRPVQRERRPELHQWCHPTDGRFDAGQGAAVERLHPADVDGGGPPTERSGEVDEAPCRQVELDRAGRLLLDLRPGLVGDGRELAHQMVHGRFLPSSRREPMPSVPSDTTGTASGFGVGRSDPGQRVAVDMGEAARHDRGCRATLPPRSSTCRRGGRSRASDS